LGSFTKSLNGTRELIEGIKSSLKEKGILERSVQVFRQEIQNKVVRTIDTRNVSQQVDKLEFSGDLQMRAPSSFVGGTIDADSLEILANQVMQSP
jgi:hypothetical protein